MNTEKDNKRGGEGKHTPGPWVISEEKGHVYVSGQEYVAEIDRLFTRGSQRTEWDAVNIQMANAALIAAAPELLAALIECVTEPGAACFQDDDRDMLVRRLRAINEVARAAIRKALGQ